MAEQINVKGKMYDEHKDWPKLKSQVDRAFKDFDKTSLFAMTDVMGTENDAMMEVTDAIDMAMSEAIIDDKKFSCGGYVFYCDSAVREARLSDQDDLSLYINIGTYTGENDPFETDPDELQEVSKQVVDVMESNGLKAEPSDAEPTYIFVSLKK